jgi:LysM repeat protein
MESDTIDNNSESKFPLIAGIAGIALGVIALILAVKAKNAADAATTSSLAASQAAGEAAAAVASKADGAAVQGLVADYTAFKAQTENAFKDAAAAYNKLATAVTSGGGSRSSGGAVAGPGEYIVVKGDTLSGIARKNGISLKAIQDLNPGVGAALRIGQKIRVK